MVKIQSIEYFRVLPRWLFVKVTDEEGQYGWGESTLEGHTEAIEGTLSALSKRFQGYEAEYVHYDKVSYGQLTDCYLQRHRTYLADSLASRFLSRRPGLHVRHLGH